ncbi:MAG: phosphodiester glycosidase family protein [Christensenellaceae bacterium]|nr:phosphodiester glycosidase family protein [Christensenellaceae bacterium]
MKKLFALLAALLLLASTGSTLAEGDFSDVFPDKFLAEGEAPVITETSYQSQDIWISISTQRYGRADVYVADIYVRSLENFQRAYSHGKYGVRNDQVKNIADESNAVLAITGDSSDNFTAGWVIGNGVVERDSRNRVRDLCVIYKNGEMRTYPRPGNPIHEQITQEKDDIWHTFLFGPSLLDEEGKAITKFDSNIRFTNPRAVLGYYEPGHYCFVQVDGRSTKSVIESGALNHGLELKDLALLMESLGCKAAYNLDGGRSAMLYFNGGIVSSPASGGKRLIGDILVIKEIR